MSKWRRDTAVGPHESVTLMSVKVKDPGPSRSHITMSGCFGKAELCVSISATQHPLPHSGEGIYGEGTCPLGQHKAAEWTPRSAPTLQLLPNAMLKSTETIPLVLGACVLLANAWWQASLWELLLALLVAVAGWRAAFILQRRAASLQFTQKSEQEADNADTHPAVAASAASTTLLPITVEPAALPPEPAALTTETGQGTPASARAEAPSTSEGAIPDVAAPKAATPEAATARNASFEAVGQDTSEPIAIDKADSAVAARPEKSCLACEASSSNLLRCSRCRVVHFCNATCQRRAWAAGHKDVCGKTPPAAKASPTDSDSSDKASSTRPSPAPEPTAAHLASSSRAQACMAAGTPSSNREAAALWDQACRQARESNSPASVRCEYARLGTMARLQLGEIDEASTRADEAVELASTTGEANLVAQARTCRSWSAHALPYPTLLHPIPSHPPPAPHQPYPTLLRPIPPQRRGLPSQVWRTARLR